MRVLLKLVYFFIFKIFFLSFLYVKKNLWPLSPPNNVTPPKFGTAEDSTSFQGVTGIGIQQKT